MPSPPTILPHTEVHPLPDGELRLLGAVRQVTGAMSRLDAGRGARLLVDCGVAQGRDRASVDLPALAKEVDALVLTHGHLDHIGEVPTLLESGWEGPIYATQATLRIARLSLEDSLDMQDVPREDAARILRRLDTLARPLRYGAAASIGSLSVALHEAGHILGSASAEIRTRKSRVILSGDLGRPDSPILRDPNTTWASGPVDLVVMEATYGGRDHAHSHDDIGRALETIVKSAIARKARVLVPAFAIGRTQTLLYFLNDLVESKRIPAIPVFVDTPMGLAVTETYSKFRPLFDKESLDRLARGDDPLDFVQLFQVERGRDSQKLRDVDGPAIIIAGSGMCTGGRIVHHLRDGLPHEDTTVLFVGYQGEGTPGRRIQEAAKRGGKVWIDGAEVLVRAEIRTLHGLSAHADRTELLAWLKAIGEVRRVALHHGDVASQEAFATWAGARLSPSPS